MTIQTPVEFAERIVECLAIKAEEVGDLFNIDEDRDGYFVATLCPRKFLNKEQFKMMCALVKDLGGEGYLQGAKAWKIPGPLAKKSPTPIPTAIPTEGSESYKWSPWYNGAAPGTHYRARMPGNKIEECLPESRNPQCTICHSNVATEKEIKISQSSELHISALSEDEDVQGLRGSQKKIGSLYPVLVNSSGEVIDGYHRLKANPDWPRFTVEGITDPLQLAKARLISNERRNVSPQEKAQLLREIYVYSKWSPKQMAEELGWSISSVYRYLPDDLKGPEPPQFASSRLELGMDKTVSDTTVKPQDMTVGKAREPLDTPAGREVFTDAVKEALAKGEVPSSDDEESLFAEGIKTVEDEPVEGSEKTDVGSPRPLHDGEHPHRLQGVQVGEFECSECHQHFFIDHITAEKHRLKKVRSAPE